MKLKPLDVNAIYFCVDCDAIVEGKEFLSYTHSLRHVKPRNKKDSDTTSLVKAKNDNNRSDIEVYDNKVSSDFNSILFQPNIALGKKSLIENTKKNINNNAHSQNSPTRLLRSISKIEVCDTNPSCSKLSVDNVQILVVDNNEKNESKSQGEVTQPSLDKVNLKLSTELEEKNHSTTSVFLEKVTDSEASNNTKSICNGGVNLSKNLIKNKSTTVVKSMTKPGSSILSFDSDNTQHSTKSNIKKQNNQPKKQNNEFDNQKLPTKRKSRKLKGRKGLKKQTNNNSNKSISVSEYKLNNKQVGISANKKLQPELKEALISSIKTENGLNINQQNTSADTVIFTLKRFSGPLDPSFLNGVKQTPTSNVNGGLNNDGEVKGKLIQPTKRNIRKRKLKKDILQPNPEIDSNQISKQLQPAKKKYQPFSQIKNMKKQADNNLNKSVFECEEFRKTVSPLRTKVPQAETSKISTLPSNVVNTNELISADTAVSPIKKEDSGLLPASLILDSITNSHASNDNPVLNTNISNSDASIIKIETASEALLRKRIERRRKNGESFEFACKFCQRVLRTPGGLMKHEAMHGHEEHTCVTCGRVFHRREKLRFHVKVIHEGERYFTCAYCGHGSSTKQNLLVHINSHLRRKHQHVGCTATSNTNK